jgi:hypothetical protein
LDAFVRLVHFGEIGIDIASSYASIRGKAIAKLASLQVGENSFH